MHIIFIKLLLVIILYHVHYTAYHCVKHRLDKNERGDQGKIQVGGQKYSHTYPYRCTSPPGQQQHAMRKQCKFFVV